jgi:hypothetical protein
MDQKRAFKQVVLLDAAGSLSEYGHPRFADVRAAVEEFLKSGKCSKKKLAIAPWDDKGEEEVVLLKQKKSVCHDDVQFEHNGTTFSLKELLSHELFRRPASFFRQKPFTVTRCEAGVLDCTCVEHEFQHQFFMADRNRLWEPYYPAPEQAPSPFSGVEWKDVAPVVVYALGESEEACVSSLHVRCALERLGCPREVAYDATRMDSANEVLLVKSREGNKGNDDFFFVVNRALIDFVSHQLGEALESSVSAIKETSVLAIKETERTKKVLAAVGEKNPDVAAVNKTLKTCGSRETSHGELTRIAKRGFCTVETNGSVTLTDSGRRQVEDLLPVSNVKRSTCERALKREREEEEIYSLSEDSEEETMAPPSIDAVMALVDERVRDARAQKDRVDGWIEALKQAHDSFPEISFHDASMQKAGEYVKNALDITSEPLEKAQQELDEVLTARRKAKEIRKEQSALDLRLRDLHDHLAKERNIVSR